MSIIQVEGPKVRPFMKVKKLAWHENFKRTLYRKNYQKIKTKKKEKNLIEQEEKNVAVKQLIKIFGNESKNSDIEREFYQPENQQNYYTPYSIYIPLESESFLNDEIMNTFPYIRDVVESKSKDERLFCYQDINLMLSGQEKTRKMLNIDEQWKKIKKKYLCRLDSLKSLGLFIMITKYGSNIIQNLKQQYAPHCLSSVFKHCIFKSIKYLRPTTRLYKNLSVSINLGDEITLKTLSDAQKSLYCPVCYLYDCGKHQSQERCIEERHHYFNYANKITQSQNIRKIINLFRKYKQIIDDQDNEDLMEIEEDESKSCSASCYLDIKKNKLDKISAIKYRVMSPFVKSLIQMGIHMFSYNPCKIAKLFKGEKKDNITCQLLYVHFIEDLNLLTMINNKMHKSQKDLIHHEGKQNTVQLQNLPTKAVQMRKKVDYAQLRNKNPQPQVPICYHNFLDSGTADPSCEKCSCKSRGFCLPSCQCTPSCKLKRIGCTCKENQTCQNQKCFCFKNKLECQPYVCGECFPSLNKIKKNSCRNEKILRKTSKKIMIGISGIPGAGLGAFAGENYMKNDLVSIYSGQNINSDMDHIRECMMKVLSFYNFDSPNGKQYNASIDARFMGNKARFINHGNEGETNLQSSTMFSNGTQHIAIYASRDIREGEELKFNYDGSGLLYQNHRDKYPFIKQKKNY